jgi:hypothetical protein
LLLLRIDSCIVDKIDLVLKKKINKKEEEEEEEESEKKKYQRVERRKKLTTLFWSERISEMKNCKIL